MCKPVNVDIKFSWSTAVLKGFSVFCFYPETSCVYRLWFLKNSSRPCAVITFLIMLVFNHVPSEEFRVTAVHCWFLNFPLAEFLMSRFWSRSLKMSHIRGGILKWRAVCHTVVGEIRAWFHPLPWTCEPLRGSLLMPTFNISPLTC